MNKIPVFLILLVILSCTNQNSSNRAAADHESAEKDSLTFPKITILSQLPDSLQPKTAPYSPPVDMPVPVDKNIVIKRDHVRGGKIEVTLKPAAQFDLKALVDDDEKPALDVEGKPYLVSANGLADFRYFTTDHGLPIDGASCSATDRFGNIWFGTTSGLSRYDGKTFTNFSTNNGLASSTVHCITIDKKGHLWIGTDGGVSRYDGYTFINYTKDQGLPTNKIHGITQDDKGNIWLAAFDGGISRLDGKKVQTACHLQTCKHNLKNKVDFEKHKREITRSVVNFRGSLVLLDANYYVTCSSKDNEGNLWFGTYGGGVIRYDHQRDHLPCNNGTCKHNLKVKSETAAHDQELSKSFLTFSLDDNQNSPGGIVNCITKDRYGNQWISLLYGGIYRYDAERAKAPCNTASCHHDLSNPTEREDHKKKLLMGFSNINVSHGLKPNAQHIFEDSKGNLWFAHDDGISKFDRKRINIPCLRKTCNHNAENPNDALDHKREIANSIVNISDQKSEILSIAEDHSGNLWLGTSSKGVICYKGKTLHRFTKSQGLAGNSVGSITEDEEGNLWFASDQGASCFKGRGFSNYGKDQALPDQILGVFKEKNGPLWFGTFFGAFRYDKKKLSYFNSDNGLVTNYITSINQDHDGNIWFCTQKGISMFDGKSFMNFYDNQGLTDDCIVSSAVDQYGNLWFGSDGNGVSRFDGKSFINFTTKQGLAHNSVWDITIDRSGNLWFGTERGISVITSDEVKKLSALVDRPKSKNEKFISPFHSFTTKDGLPDNFVSEIVQMPNGKIGLGTNVGLCFFNFSNIRSKIEGIEIFNSTTGYPIKDLNFGENAMYADRQGILWVGGTDPEQGLVRFDYGAVVKNSKTPEIVIQNIRINQQDICWHDLDKKNKSAEIIFQQSGENNLSRSVFEELATFKRELKAEERKQMLNLFGDITFDKINPFYPIPQNLVLPYKNNTVSFDFQAIETGRNFMVRYQFMLEGLDDNWSPLTEKTSAVFGNLFEGTYTFKLKARSPEGVWSAPITYTFTVLPPWYRTWWAYTIYILLFLFALRVFSKWRERKLRAENEKLEHTVEIRTAEVVAEKKEVEKQKQRSDELLLNILPEEVAEELKAKGSADAKSFDVVTVMFTDFKGFTEISEKLSPSELVAEIHYCFKAFDTIITKYNIEKIKTIGDAYMCVGGLPIPNDTNAYDVVSAAMEIQQFMQEHLTQRKKEGKELFEIRIGIHTGPVVAGIVGIKKFAYDIWGDTVNTASRMESSGEAGKINISGSTYQLIKDQFKCTYRGKIQAKGKGEIDMYFVEKKNT